MTGHRFVAFFLNENEKKLKNQTDIYSKKHFNLSIESFKTPQDLKM